MGVKRCTGQCDKCIAKCQAPLTVLGSETFSSQPTGDLGIAIDIGTTTLAFKAIDLENGATCQTHGMANSQRALGADVITRIKKASEGDLPRLNAYILEDIRQGLEKFPLEKIKSIVIAGNTTMLHILQNLPCKTLGMHPFTPVDIELRQTKILGIKTTLLPGISAFVGADITAGILASPGPGLLIDLGTNGEMALFSDNQILVTSTAAGPAFEAANISCGVPSIPGAISKVRYLPETNVFKYETIAGAPPIGICGTGVIDIAAQLVIHGLADETGRMEAPSYEIAPGITFTQMDMREIQLAKSALRAGIEILLETAGYGYNDAPNVFLAGGLGHHIDLESAAAIGLIPEARGISIGNASLEGAARILTDPTAIDKIQAIAAKAKEINLSTHHRFNDLFTEHMMFE